MDQILLFKNQQQNNNYTIYDLIGYFIFLFLFFFIILGISYMIKIINYRNNNNNYLQYEV